MPKKKNIETPPMPSQKASSFIPVIGKTKDKVLSKYEAEFNKKIIRINNLKTEIANIKEEIENARSRIFSDLFPLMGVITEKQTKYVFLLDAAYDSGFFKKRDSETLMEYIIELCEQVLSKSTREDDDETSEESKIQAIKDKYDTLLYSEDEKELLDANAKEMISKMFGIDLDEVTEMENDPEAFFEKRQQKIDEQQNNFQEQQLNRKKTKKQIEKEQKLEEGKKMLAKDIRTIYMSLAKELHPDLEQDEEERLRKTEMMKRVTVAYENNDLFELLKLQLEYQIAHERIEGLIEDQVKRYNQLLQTQIQELENSKYEIIGFRSPVGAIYHKFCGKPPQVIEKIFRQEKMNLQETIDSLLDFLDAHTDYRLLKDFLKEVRKEHKQRKRNFVGFGHSW
ncbi:MAG: hypothetical protein EAZ08_02745 [Cytophagales bacterium]|nr:MAG: hypothetical protein EAZ08_02745 [Cytophagales bacterium]